MSIRNPAPGAQQAAAIEGWKATFVTIEAAILEKVPTNRERALALTNLEQASMWLTKTILEGSQ